MSLSLELGPVMIDIAGTELTQIDIDRLSHPLVGGVILFARNYSNIAQLSQLTQHIHALRTPSLLIAVDHEGGRVQRFIQGFTKLPAMRELGVIWDQRTELARHLAFQVGYVLAAELNACGIDFSFTPVLDIDHGTSSVIGDRAFHSDPDVVINLAQCITQGLKKGGMLAVAKHFPGHGYIQADSHLQACVDDRSLNDIGKIDLIPFRRMIDYGVSGIMVAHVIFPKVDQKPAGFSAVWLQQVLRTELQFDGCIFSDDLTMRGAGVEFCETMLQRAQAALSAGCDMILVCNNKDGVDEILQALQWDMLATSRLRLARMHAKQLADSMLKLREQKDYIQAVDEIDSIKKA
ncbi:beta-N-acetylhexosaminidase [Nitrosomonas sp. PY1]|uniref:beta-N-acetylhexosaminidase n=1 Tax=Nitrosomonas sp. PY1 TaxID=1803906 RepID=UPI001FC7BCAF|nr:beta-N-acetylhexosaminidase [Nitrosomonas sp. PY1]GKS69629.1 beta-N-acetylhexosaminidase [Nitrosomonas sp. PY1]